MPLPPRVRHHPAERISADAKGLALGPFAALCDRFRAVSAEFVVPLLLGIVASVHGESARRLAWKPAEGPARCRRHGDRDGKRDPARWRSARTRCAGKCEPSSTELPEAASDLTFAEPELARMRKSARLGNDAENADRGDRGGKGDTQTAVPAAPRQPATHVIVDQPTFKINDFLWQSSMGALGAMGQAAMVVFWCSSC